MLEDGLALDAVRNRDSFGVGSCCSVPEDVIFGVFRSRASLDNVEKLVVLETSGKVSTVVDGRSGKVGTG